MVSGVVHNHLANDERGCCWMMIELDWWDLVSKLLISRSESSKTKDKTIAIGFSTFRTNLMDSDHSNVLLWISIALVQKHLQVISLAFVMLSNERRGSDSMNGNVLSVRERTVKQATIVSALSLFLPLSAHQHEQGNNGKRKKRIERYTIWWKFIVSSLSKDIMFFLSLLLSRALFVSLQSIQFRSKWQWGQRCSIELCWLTWSHGENPWRRNQIHG